MELGSNPGLTLANLRGQPGAHNPHASPRRVDVDAGVRIRGIIFDGSSSSCQPAGVIGISIILLILIRIKTAQQRRFLALRCSLGLDLGRRNRTSSG